MIEGWQGEDYLILLDEDESARATESYALSTYVPNYTIIGLCGWDDFILHDSENRLFTLPTVPMHKQHLRPLGFAFDKTILQSDERFKGKIKWYVQPIIFGGDPNDGKNISWINLHQHTVAVKWWNQKYSEMKESQKSV